ncbi:MAG: two-component system response regulator [Desulfuromonadales bacterium C00003068]|nr:MAG: two-component system response regulator [Desulfuromonadales bacterium C00003068]
MNALTIIYDAKILIVDDNLANVALLEAILEEEDYGAVFSTTDPRDVLPLYRQHQFDLILLDIRMPWLSGIEVLNLLREEIVNDYVPVIVLTAQTDMETREQALTAGAKDFITKPFEDWEVLLRIQNMLETRMYYMRQVDRANNLEQEVRKRTEEIRLTQLETVRRLGVAGEFRDNETGAHVLRMSHICSMLAKKLGLSETYCEMILYASSMHDVGKIGVRDAVLLKQGKLDDEEWKLMKRHPQIGAQIIGNQRSELMTLAREIALNHHEKWDGNGYPCGLGGDEIPVSARIAAISDVFDALTSQRPYKEAWSIEKAVALISEESGRHFDPAIVEIFIDNIDEIIEIKERYVD